MRKVRQWLMRIIRKRIPRGPRSTSDGTYLRDYVDFPVTPSRD